MVKSFAQTPQVWRSAGGDPELVASLSTLKCEYSLSNDHLSLRVAVSSESTGMDQLSEDPPLETLADSLPQSGGGCEEVSSEIENGGDLYSGILLAGAWCKNWGP